MLSEAKVVSEANGYNYLVLAVVVTVSILIRCVGSAIVVIDDVSRLPAAAVLW